MLTVARRRAHAKPADTPVAPATPAWLLASAALVIAALVLPPRSTAAALVGAEAAVLPDVVTGVWLFKLGLLVHGVALLALARAGRRSQSVPAEVSAPAAPAAPLPGPQAERWLLVGILLAAAVLRVIELNAGLWFDEIRTFVAYGRQPFGIIAATYDSQNQHLLYSLLARAALGLFGESGWALRLPAVIFGVASLGAVYWFGRLIVRPREALMGTLLLAVSYHHVWFSQNARGYTALMLGTLIASGLLLQLLAQARPARSLAVGYAATMALTIFTHVTAVFVVAAHALVWAVVSWHRGRRGERVGRMPVIAFALAGTLSFQAYALVLPQFMRVLFKPATSAVTAEWKEPGWLVAELLRGLSEGVPGGLVVVGAAVIVGGIGLVSLVRERPLATSVMLLPAVLTAAALVATDHNLWPRFFFFSAGFAVLIGVRGIVETVRAVAPRSSPKLAAAALLVAAAASALTLPRAWAPKQDFGGARDYVLRAQRTGDAIVAVDLARYPYEQFFEAGWLGADSGAELERIERGHARTWVLYTFPTRLSAVQPEIWQRLEREYRTAATFPGTVGGGAVVVKVKS